MKVARVRKGQTGRKGLSDHPAYNRELLVDVPPMLIDKEIQHGKKEEGNRVAQDEPCYRHGRADQVD